MFTAFLARTDFGLYRDRRAESNLKDAWHAILHRIHICHIYHPVFQHCDIYTLLSNDIELAWHTMLVCHSTNLFGFSSMIVKLAHQPLIVQQSNEYVTKCSKTSTFHSLELVYPGTELRVTWGHWGLIKKKSQNKDMMAIEGGALKTHKSRCERPVNDSLQRLSTNQCCHGKRIK